MRTQVLGRVVVAAKDMVRVSVDLDVVLDSKVRRGNPLVVLVDVLVLVSAQERAFNDTGVLNTGLIDRDAIVLQVE